jgi:hypothetical protein
MQAGCYERKNGHRSKVSFARGKLWKLPRYGNCGKSFKGRGSSLSCCREHHARNPFGLSRRADYMELNRLTIPLEVIQVA